MRLLSLSLRNFKGCKEITLEPRGKNLRIYGDNAAGKTTIADAFYWLLFDKDSQSKKDFEIKTLDLSGKPIPMLEHEVRAVLDTGDGAQVVLGKVYKETYVKKRGSVSAEFTGHTTDYFIDGVPTQKKEYDQYIARLCEERRFRLLTDPTYFNTVLKWEDRRRMLIEVCGDVTDADVIASNSKLSTLPQILGSHSIDNYRKILRARRTETNNEIEAIPVRIDELSRGLSQVQDVPDVSAQRSELEVLREQKATLQAGGHAAELRRQIAELQTKALSIRQELMSAANQPLEAARGEHRSAESKVSGLQIEVDRLKVTIAEKERQVDVCKAKREELLAEYTKIQNERFVPGNETCETCGQALPTEQAEALWQEAHAKRLEKNIALGKANRAERERLEGEIAGHKAEADSLAEEFNRALAARESAKAHLNSLSSTAVDEEHPELVAILTEQVGLEEQLKTLQADSRDAVLDIETRISVLNGQIQEADKIAAANAEAERGATRLEELRSRQKELGIELTRIDHELFLTEEFIRTKVSMLEEKINSKFELATFKLFEPQINGGLAECCETVVGGVPYGSLNHGARLNVGLDIINTFARHENWAPPVVIDNAESVTAIRPTSGQQIQLIVSAHDKTLRVENTAQEALAV